ncbi:MAG: MATE family efflux transporter [Tissierellia bacterium]|nr:MATE family efflux transporter [Tissierellia bacterium]
MEKSLKTQFRNYVVPSILAMWVFSFYTMVDGFFVANFVSQKALAAVNLSLPFINTLFSVGILFAVGTQTRIGILKGQDKKDQANCIFSFTFFTVLFVGIFLASFTLIFLEPLIHFLGASLEYHDMVKKYLGIVLFFAPFFMISYHLEILVKVDGFPRLATFGVLSSCVVNILLDYLFVGVFGWGLTGAAYATGIAQITSAIIFTKHFLGGHSYLRFVKFPWNFSVYRQILPVGFGDFLSELSGAFVVLIYNLFLIKLLGYTSVAIFTVINYISQFVLSTMVGITQGIQPLCSYYHGQRKPLHYRKIFHYAIISVGVFVLLLVGLLQLFPEMVFRLFFDGSEGAILHEGALALRRFSPGYLFSGYSLLIAGYHSSLGKAKESITINLFQGFLSILLSLLLMSSFFPNDQIWWSYPLAQIFTLIVAILILIRSRRKTDLRYGLES